MEGEERRAEELDPNGGPEPVRKSESRKWLRVAVKSLAIAVGGVVLVIIACPFTATHGATQSARLEFERRQQVIEEAHRERNAAAEQPSSVLPGAEQTADE